MSDKDLPRGRPRSPVPGKKIVARRKKRYAGGKKLSLFLADQLRGEVDQHLAVVLADAAEKKAQPMNIASRFAFEAPLVVAVGGLHCSRERGGFGRRLAVVEEEVERDVESKGEFFERRQRRNRAA